MNRVPKFFRERRVRNILESYRKGWFYKTSGPRYTAMGYGMMCAVILISVTQSVKIDTKMIKFTIISLCSSSKSAASSVWIPPESQVQPSSVCRQPRGSRDHMEQSV